MSGAWKGLASDPSIATCSGVKDWIQGTQVLADKAYRGDQETFITPVLPPHGQKSERTLSPEERAYNYLVYSARQTIERIIRRMKVFGVLTVPWRYSFHFHELCTKVIGKLVNLFLMYEPLG